MAKKNIPPFGWRDAWGTFIFLYSGFSVLNFCQQQLAQTRDMATDSYLKFKEELKN